MSFLYVHLNRLILKYVLNMIYLAGPGHVASGLLGPVYLEGGYSEIYPDKSQDQAGLREHFPDLKLRFINVVDLFTLAPADAHPHGLSDRDFDSLFTLDRPIIFNFHGYPWLIHRLAYRRTNHAHLHVRGYKEKGSINTPLDLAIQNQIDRFSLVIDVINRVPELLVAGADVKQKMRDRQLECLAFAHQQGI